MDRAKTHDFKCGNMTNFVAFTMNDIVEHTRRFGKNDPYSNRQRVHCSKIFIRNHRDDIIDTSNQD